MKLIIYSAALGTTALVIPILPLLVSLALCGVALIFFVDKHNKNK